MTVGTGVTVSAPAAREHEVRGSLVELGEEREATVISNLLVVPCGEQTPPSPLSTRVRSITEGAV
ncbi:hypothetical protein FHX42_002765 [Saccharopolyspora lacisalsi]|uniref:Uncharacterized protein n=1 Tax=Halosaccharopolyspora lacisalsi TaxID=1000566 RepID=A0A839DV98_9PSEU|nr:hypothetical protein [Halosaccharopolyspora lacisalsi]MBA8825414.1 hypothetical protein [Halosaccharopolyspora lacisalsi]